jgi:hypothetical protein
VCGFVGGARDSTCAGEAERELVVVDPQLQAIETRVEVCGPGEPGL